MEFTVNTLELKNAINKAKKGISKGASEGGSAYGISFHITKNDCYIITTDTKIWVETKILLYSPVESDISFILMKPTEFIKALKYFNNNIVTFNIVDDVIKIVCGNKIMEQVYSNKSCLVHDSINTDICNNYKYTIDNLKYRFNKIKYALGNNIDILKDSIHFANNDMVAIDGYRVAVNKDAGLNITEPFTVESEVIKRCIDVLCDNIVINVNNKFIEIKDNDTSVYSCVVVQKYFDYKEYLTKGTECISIDKKQYIDALEYLNIFGGKTTKKVVIWQNNVLSFKDSKNSCIINIDKNLPFTIGYNSQYMLDALKQCESDNLTLFASNATSSIVCEDDNNIFLVLPIRL